MIKKTKTLKLWVWLAGMVVILGLAACTPSEPVEETPLPEPEIETSVPAEADPPETLPAPVAEPTVWLVVGAGADPVVLSETQQRLEALVADAAMRLDILEALSAEMITPDVQVVVGVGRNLGFNNLAPGAPGVSFVAIGDPDAAVLENLSVIGDPSLEARQQAFMAGYVSALISSDNKVAALFAEQTAERDLLAESYIVGARFYCGICRPVYPPYNEFPQWEALSSAQADSEFRPILNYYYNIGVEVVFVHGELASPALLGLLEELDIKAVSDRSPDLLRSNWAGTIAMDPVPAFEALWPDLLAGAPGTQVPAAIVLRDNDMGLISEGRYRLFEKMVTNIHEGNVIIEFTP